MLDWSLRSDRCLRHGTGHATGVAVARTVPVGIHRVLVGCLHLQAVNGRQGVGLRMMVVEMMRFGGQRVCGIFHAWSTHL